MVFLRAIAQSSVGDIELAIEKHRAVKHPHPRLRAEATLGLPKHSNSESCTPSPGRLWAPLFDRSKAFRPFRPEGGSTPKPAPAPRKVDSLHWPARYKIPPSSQDWAPWH